MCFATAYGTGFWRHRDRLALTRLRLPTLNTIEVLLMSKTKPSPAIEETLFAITNVRYSSKRSEDVSVTTDLLSDILRRFPSSRTA